VRRTWEGAGMSPGPALRCLRPRYIPQVSPLLRLFPFLIVVLFLSFVFNHLPSSSNIVGRHPCQTNSHRTLPARQIRVPVDAQPHDPPRNQSSTTSRLFPSVKDTMQNPSPMNFDEISTDDQWHFKNAKPFQYMSSQEWVLC
jgi:hypothetical protein